MTHDAATLRGGCHCGCLSLELSTLLTPAAIAPRACDCSFCRKHGASWISDPAGRLKLELRGEPPLEYRQGSGAAQFLLCRRCGVLVATTYAHAARIYAAVNAACLDGNPGFGATLTVSPQKLDAEQKTARWRELWVPDVRIVQIGVNQDAESHPPSLR